ncbi:hypothetical protein F2P56_002525 [Juglans regia]|uniref:Protein FAR-RED IMPAIRED RESPONSE 1-like n=2 Tax=Juglans regia TaxID=51240 RepID=A0A2I4GMY9_JUGRE|nr:protein FAR-RED IMPAIRED RESPONSE 1-like [Juglans regia]KAF5481913.1 hypothetical protein F2P56_002525 [Juglans regia]
MSCSASSVSSSVVVSSSVQTSVSVAASSCSALPTFIPPTSTNPYPCGSEENKVQQSSSVEEISEATLDSIEVEAQSTASLGNTVDTKEVGTDGGDITEEPKPEMRFESDDELMNYYKHYGKVARHEIGHQTSPSLGQQAKQTARCNREVNEFVRRVLDINDETGIRMNKSFHALVTEAGRFENLPFGEKDCRNYIDKTRHLRLGKGGAQALFEYFRMMQYKNDGFFSLMELDDDDRLKSVFWADAHSRGA